MIFVSGYVMLMWYVLCLNYGVFKYIYLLINIWYSFYMFWVVWFVDLKNLIYLFYMKIFRFIICLVDW